MQHKNHHKTIHQHIEGALRHRLMLVLVLGCMLMGAISTDSRFREIMRSVYAQGWGFIGMYMTHEHPSHQHNTVSVARIPTVSSY